MVHSIEGKRPEYYEAILQLRDTTAQTIDFAYTCIEQAKIHIAKIVESKQGIDFYLADSQFTKTLAKRVQGRFGGQILITATLFTKKDGKDIYRITVLFRGVPFKKSDIVVYGGEEYRIKSLEKEIWLQHVKHGKKVRVRYSESSKIKIKDTD